MFLPAAAARSTTSRVAIIVVAIPCTGVSLIPGNDLVHGLCTPGNSHLLADPVNDLSRSQRCQRSVGLCQLSRQGRACAENETTTGEIAHPSCSLRGAKNY